MVGKCFKIAIGKSNETFSGKQFHEEEKKKNIQQEVVNQLVRVVVSKIKKIISLYKNKKDKNKMEAHKTVASLIVSIMEEHRELVKSNIELIIKEEFTAALDSAKYGSISQSIVSDILNFPTFKFDLSEGKYNTGKTLKNEILEVLKERTESNPEKEVKKSIFSDYMNPRRETSTDDLNSTYLDIEDRNKRFDKIFKKRIFCKSEYKKAQFVRTENFTKKSQLVESNRLTMSIEKKPHNYVNIDFKKQTVHFEINQGLIDQVNAIQSALDVYKLDMEKFKPNINGIHPAIYPIFIPSKFRGIKAPPHLLVDEISKNLEENEKNLKYMVIVVIEENEFEIYNELFGKFLKEYPEQFHFLIMNKEPDAIYGIGKIRTIISYFAEVLDLDFYHACDDDLEFSEFIAENNDWKTHDSAIRRCFFSSQQVIWSETFRTQKEIISSISESIKKDKDLENNAYELREKLISKLIFSLHKEELIEDFLSNYTEKKELLKKIDKLFEIFETEIHRLKGNVGQIGTLNIHHDGQRGQSNSKYKTDSIYKNQLLEFSGITHKTKSTIYQCVLTNSKLTRGVYCLDDSSFFELPLTVEDFKKKVKKRKLFATVIQDLKTEKKNESKGKTSYYPTFEEVHTIKGKKESFDLKEHAEFIRHGYCAEDKLLVNKMAFHGFESYYTFVFSIKDIKNYPSICNGDNYSFDKNKSLEKNAETVEFENDIEEIKIMEEEEDDPMEEEEAFCMEEKINFKLHYILIDKIKLINIYIYLFSY